MPGPIGGGGGVAMPGGITAIPHALQQRNYTIAGTTVDVNGSPIAAVTVKLFYTASDTLAQQTVSDSVGAYSFTVDNSVTFYTVEYKAGPPDVFGSSANTLQGT